MIKKTGKILIAAFIVSMLTPVFLLMMTDRLICTLVETDKTISELLSWEMI